MALVKFTTDIDTDASIEFLKRHFDESTSSKAAVRAVNDYQRLDDDLKTAFRQNVRLSRLLSEAHAALSMKRDADFNLQRVFESLDEHLKCDC